MNENMTRRSLVVNLTEQEIMEYSKELARTTTLQAEIEEEKKTVTSSFKEKLDRCISDSRSLARKISTRQDYREVECEWRFDYNRRVKTLFRMDTWEQVEERKLTADELQDELDFNGPGQEEHPPGCPKCEGDGEYYSDDLDGDAGQIYCDCPAGVALKEKENAEIDKDEAELCGDEPEELTAEQIETRDATCHEWRECLYSEKCFEQDLAKCDPVCFKDIEAAKAIEKEEPASDEPFTDPLANDNGVYADCEEITIPIPTKARATASISVAHCSDGFWRNGHNHALRDLGGGGCLPTVKSMGHCTRTDAIIDALEKLQDRFEGYRHNNPTAVSRINVAIKALLEFEKTLPEETKKMVARCPLCDFTGDNKTDLIKHIRATHNMGLQEAMGAASTDYPHPICGNKNCTSNDPVKYPDGCAVNPDGKSVAACVNYAALEIGAAA